MIERAVYYYLKNLIDKASRIQNEKESNLKPNEYETKLIKIFGDAYVNV